MFFLKIVHFSNVTWIISIRIRINIISSIPMTFSFLLWDSFLFFEGLSFIHMLHTDMCTQFVFLPSVWAWGEGGKRSKAIKVDPATFFNSGDSTWCFIIKASTATQLRSGGPFTPSFCLIIYKMSDLLASDSESTLFPHNPLCQACSGKFNMCLVCLLPIRFVKYW